MVYFNIVLNLCFMIKFLLNDGIINKFFKAYPNIFNNLNNLKPHKITKY
jgi:hypothetical protein